MKILFAGVAVALALIVSSVSLAGNKDFEKGIRYYQKRDFRHAEQSLRRYVKEVPDPVGYYLLGYAEYKMKKFAKAKKDFSEAYLIDPDVSPKVDEMLKGSSSR